MQLTSNFFSFTSFYSTGLSPLSSPSLGNFPPHRHWFLLWTVRAPPWPSSFPPPLLCPKHSWGDHLPLSTLPALHEAFPGWSKQRPPPPPTASSGQAPPNQRTLQLCCSWHLFLGLFSIFKFLGPFKSLVCYQVSHPKHLVSRQEVG